MLIEHQHKPGVFDPGHCRDCARQTDMLDTTGTSSVTSSTSGTPTASPGRPDATPPGPCGRAGVGILLAAIALLTG
jgi:hypothetical protein